VLLICDLVVVVVLWWGGGCCGCVFSCGLIVSVLIVGVFFGSGGFGICFVS